MYKDLFNRITVLYKEKHEIIHNKEWIDGFGERVHGIRMYKNGEYVSAEYKDGILKVDIGNNGMFDLSSTIQEGSCGPTLMPVSFLTHVLRALEQRDEAVMKNVDGYLIPGGKTSIQTEIVTKEKEVAPPDYGEVKAKAGILDKLLAKNSLSMND